MIKGFQKRYSVATYRLAHSNFASGEDFKDSLHRTATETGENHESVTRERTKSQTASSSIKKRRVKSRVSLGIHLLIDPFFFSSLHRCMILSNSNIVL